MIHFLIVMNEKIRRIAVHTLAGFFRWAHRNRFRMLAVALWMAYPLLAIGRFLARHVLIYLLHAVIFVRRLLRSWGLPYGERLGAWLTHRAFVHAVAIFFVLVVGVANVSAQISGSTSAGERSALFSLVSDDEEEGEAVVDETPPAAAANYWAPDALEALPGIDRDDLTLEDSFLEDQTVAGGALLQPTLSSGAPSVAPRTHIEEYLVRPGDTVARIATRFGVSVNTILWENNISARAALQPGNKIIILPVSGIRHAVKKGDTIEVIAKRYGSSPEKILAWTPAGALRVGDKVLVPDGRPLPAPTPPQHVGIARSVTPPGDATNPGTGRMVWPTAWRIITQYFRWKHTGVDIDGDYTTPIYAADSGVITHAGWGRTHGGYGLYFDINHGNGIVTRYGHASKLFVGVGDTVTRGQAIGMVGTTGRSTGTHLHFEVRVNNRPVNPLEYIR